MSWDKEYRELGDIWGEKPGELAIIAVKYLQKHGLNDLCILDIGCGYGRDAFYFSDNLKCRILGIDLSQRAVEMAAHKRKTCDVSFQCCDFKELAEGKYDVVFISNLYQLLEKTERAMLRNTVLKVLRPGGLLFLSTLSVKDPEHYGKDPKKFLHFCTGEELIEDFDFLDIKELYEHEYREPRAAGEAHHHISWILIGNLQLTSEPKNRVR